YTVEMVTMTVFDNPDLEVQDLEACEVGTSGVAGFDLFNAVTNADGGTLSYHATEAAAIAGTPTISKDVTVALGDSVFWIRSTNPDDGEILDCYTVEMVTMTVFDNPDLEVQDLASCEVGTSGVGGFDLFDAVTNADGGTLSYHATEAAAIAGTPTISKDVIVAIGDSVFWIRSTNPDDGEALDCYTKMPVTITVYGSPSCNITKDADATNYDNNNGALTITITETDVNVLSRTYEWYPPGATTPQSLPLDEDDQTPGIQVTGLSGGLEEPGLQYCLIVKEDHGDQIICSHECCVYIMQIPKAPECRIETQDALCFGDNTGSLEIYAKGAGPFVFELDSVDNSTTPPTVKVIYGPVQRNKVGEGDDAETMEPVSGLYAGYYIAKVEDLGSALTGDDAIGDCDGTVGQPPELTCSTVGHNSTCDASGFSLSNGWTELTVSGGTPPILVSLDGGAFVDVTTLTWDAAGYYVIGGLSGSTLGTLHTVDVKDANNCTHECDVTIYQDPCDVCETAYGYGGPDPSYSFDDDCPDGGLWDNWGWSIAISEGTYKFPMYASTPVCDPGEEYAGHVVDTAYVTVTAGGMITVDLPELFIGEGYYLSASHIWVGEDDIFPDKIAPGQWPYVANGEAFGPFSGELYIIVHGVYCGPRLPRDVPKSAEIQNPTLEESALRVYPNPFTDKVTFEFVSGRDAYGVLELYNITGQKIARILDRPVEAGVMNRVEYTPEHKVSGMYIYRLDLDGERQVGRIIYKE
ncbi:T9SS type A sorting domain-containing protein, partial [Maribellus sediminis]|uniref:T9SS type A sorting domain-containing protein n=1 Tax=Maribellus sediminis TaxID=2696285 RepID=UPI00197F2D5D